MNVFFRLVPSADRESIVGDLLEEADFRGMLGARRALWLTGECGAIAAGLSIQRAKGWFALPEIGRAHV